MKSKFDVIIIGGGPAGYVAAIRCAQLGMKTACVDKWQDKDKHASLGGTCLNVGCIPSKALIESSELYQKAKDEYAQHGIKVGKVKLDLPTMLARKDKVVSDLTQGIASLFVANHIERFFGSGKLLANKQVEITENDTSKVHSISADHIILAPGSVPSEFSAAPLTDDFIVDSTGALAFTEVPSRLAVIGAGAIGLELGSVWHRLGSEVILFKARDTFLPQVDTQIAHQALKQFRQQGMDIRLGAKVTRCVAQEDKVEIYFQNEQGEQREIVDKLIVAVGRRPNTEGLFSNDADIILDKRGFIQVDEQCRTHVADIWAIGDAVRGPMLAHKGSEEGMMVAELIAGQHAQVDYETIPSVIYTQPEIAWVGKTEQELIATGQEYHVGTFPYTANGRARALGEASGMVKILADGKTDRILGVHMIGPHSSELIAQAKIAMEFGASSEDIALTMFAHPTLTEAFHEAALAVDKRSIHTAQLKSA